MAPPQVSDVEQIAALDNPVIRNLQITQCYADLSAAMRARTGTAADWCTFATWASKQAGSTIRGEDLADKFDRMLGRRSWLLAPIRSFSRWLLQKGLFQPDTPLGRVAAEIHTPFDAFERASAEVASGNLKVFAEIGREFARFIGSVPVDGTEDAPAFAAFADSLKPGPPPDGQQYLREAFTHYQHQRGLCDPTEKAAWILLANLKIGLHEQTRLQPQIAAAVDAPLVTAADLGARVLHEIAPGSRDWPKMIQGPLAVLAGLVAKRVKRDAVNVTRDIVTESMMVLTLPTRVLSLGRNLDVPVPQVFATAHPFLSDFVQEYDSCPPGGVACGAQDWVDLHQRMHYITHLFRAFADDGSLFSAPFKAEQVASFRSGTVPTGTL